VPPPSEASRRFWHWAKNNPKEAKREHGIKPSVAKEFTDSDPGGKLPERVSNKSRDERKASRYGKK
jgi:hypothetical protein